MKAIQRKAESGKIGKISESFRENNGKGTIAKEQMEISLQNLFGQLSGITEYEILKLSRLQKEQKRHDHCSIFVKRSNNDQSDI